MTKNLEVAKILFEIADILEIKNIPWKPIAYRRAARTIETLTQDIATLYKNRGIAGLQDISGVGTHIAAKIAEYLQTGTIKEYQQLLTSIPAGVEELLHIPSIGPKRAKLLLQKLNITSIKQLEQSCKTHRICKLPGFGEKSEADILRGISLAKTSKERPLLGTILPLARELADHLRTHPAVEQLEIAGSIRRKKETCKDIDILVISKKPAAVMNHFTTLHEVKHILAKGSTKSTVILDTGIQADVRVLDHKSFGAALQYFTGNKDHNVALRTLALRKGYKLSEYGLFDKKGTYLAGRTEHDVYKKLGLPYIEPELRENTGEIEAARQGKLPALIPYNSIKGDLHTHTNQSDGTTPAETLIQAAIKHGYGYIAITDHSPAERIARGLTTKRLLAHKKEIDKLKKRYPITILFGTEVSILPNGTLDYPDTILKQLDWVIASIHSRFKSSADDMTKRIITAIQNPHVHALGHPTGRLINAREPYALHHEKIFQTAAQHNIALEINAFPSRLDLSDTHIRLAKEHKNTFVINTDSHHPDHLRYMELGVAQARRGWLEQKDVINTLPVKKFLKAIQQ